MPAFIFSFITQKKPLRSLCNGSDTVLGTGYVMLSKINKVSPALMEEGGKQMSTKKYGIRNGESAIKDQEKRQ